MKNLRAQLLYWLLVLPAATLLTMELVLQTGSAINQQFVTRTAQSAWRASGLRIVAMGDSNTYGLYLKPEESYPAQLEQLWNTRHDSKIEVINLGYPGSNSSRIVANLDDVIDRLQPDIVLVMIGTNDEWTAPITAAETTGTASSARSFLQRHSKTYRLYCLLTRQSANEIAATAFDTTMTMRDDSHSGYDAKSGLRRNLATLLDKASQHGLRIFLLTYAADRSYYRQANTIIREVAAARSYPDVIDITPAFAGRYPEKGAANDYFFNDMHATALGNRVVAEQVMQKLQQGLTP